jgi:hypothetical protein
VDVASTNNLLALTVLFGDAVFCDNVKPVVLPPDAPLSVSPVGISCKTPFIITSAVRTAMGFYWLLIGCACDSYAGVNLTPA